MSDDELPPPAFCGEDCPFMVEGCEDFCPVKAYGSEVAAKAREEGAKAEREKWQAEREKLISVIDEKIANARVAAANAVLDELAQMYANVPEQFLEGTYRLHSEWKEKIESLRSKERE